MSGVRGSGGLRWGAWACGLLALLWGATLGVRPVLAYGVAQLGVLLLLWRYPRLALRGATLSRLQAGAACEDDGVPVTLTLRHGGGLPMLAPVVEDRFGPDRVARHLLTVFPGLWPGQEADLRYEGSCFSKRGRYLVGPARLRVSCPLGLFSADALLDEGAPLTVYPGLERLPALPGTGATGRSRPGGRESGEPGQGELVLGVRDYRAGDPLRRMHWPTTARRGRPAILELERQVVSRLTILLDLSQASLRGLGRVSTLEVSVRLAASLADRALRQGDQVGLVADEAAPLRLLPAGGRAQLERILEALALVRPVGRRPLSAVLAEGWAGLAARQSLALLVADVQEDLLALLPWIERARARGCLVLAVVLDPAAFPRLHTQGRDARSGDEAGELLRAAGAEVRLVRSPEGLSASLLVPWRPLTLVARPRAGAGSPP